MRVPFRVSQRRPQRHCQFNPSLLIRYSSLFRNTSAQPSIVTFSNKIQLPVGGELTITGGTFSVNGGEYGTTGTAVDGDIIRLRATSSAEYETATDIVLSVGGAVYDTWTITTVAEAVVWHYSDAVDGSETVNFDELVIED